MLVGYMRVSTSADRQVIDLQRDALLADGVDERHLERINLTGDYVWSPSKNPSENHDGMTPLRAAPDMTRKAV
jgi:hypothetical protein